MILNMILNMIDNMIFNMIVIVHMDNTIRTLGVLHYTLETGSFWQICASSMHTSTVNIDFKRLHTMIK